MKINPIDKVTIDVPLFIRLLEYAREDAKTDMDLHNVAEKAISLSNKGETLTMKHYNKITSKEMKKKEVQRLQELAGLSILNESQGYEEDYELEDYDFPDESDSEELDEMARYADTGGAYTITPEGEQMLRTAKELRDLPEYEMKAEMNRIGIKPNQIAILVYLYKAKKEGKRVQKKDYAAEKGTVQPAVNALFNTLEGMNLITRESYISKNPASPNKGTGAPKPRIKPEDILGQIDID